MLSRMHWAMLLIRSLLFVLLVGAGLSATSASSYRPMSAC